MIFLYCFSYTLMRVLHRKISLWQKRLCIDFFPWVPVMNMTMYPHINKEKKKKKTITTNIKRIDSLMVSAVEILWIIQISKVDFANSLATHSFFIYLFTELFRRSYHALVFLSTNSRFRANRSWRWCAKNLFLGSRDASCRYFERDKIGFGRCG